MTETYKENLNVIRYLFIETYIYCWYIWHAKNTYFFCVFIIVRNNILDNFIIKLCLEFSVLIFPDYERAFFFISVANQIFHWRFCVLYTIVICLLMLT